MKLVKFEPASGDSPDAAGFRAPQLTYRITTAEAHKMPFPSIDFGVETDSGKLFSRHFELPAGTAFVEPGEGIDRTVSLDPSFGENWGDLYKKSELAKFTWSIADEENGEVQKPVHKPWP